MSERLLLSILLVFMIGCASFSAPEEPAGQAPVAAEGEADAPEAGEAVTKEAEAPPEEPADEEKAPGAEAEEERRPRDTRRRSLSALKAWVGYMQPDADDIKKAYYGIRGSHDRHVQTFGDGDGVAEMIRVAVGWQDGIDLDLIGPDHGFRVIGEERVEDDRVLPVACGEARMT